MHDSAFHTPFDGSRRPGPAAADADIRGVLIQVAGAKLLLPNAIIAEVLSYAAPEALEGAPDWLFGRIRWRGWHVPLIGFSKLAAVTADGGETGSKMLVLKALGGDPKAPYFAILSAGFPRLVTVSRAALGSDGDASESLPSLVQARVTLNEDVALVPDLVAVESSIQHALAQLEAA